MPISFSESSEGIKNITYQEQNKLIDAIVGTDESGIPQGITMSLKIGNIGNYC